MLLTLFTLGLAPVMRAQNFAAEVTVYIDPWELNLGAWTPPAPQSGVFSGGPANLMPMTIRQFDDGSITVSVQSRSQNIGVSTTESGEQTFTIGVSHTFEGSGSATFSSGTTTSTNIESSISFVMEGNLLIAVCTYPYDGYTVTNRLSIGLINPDGGFTQFQNGVLAGKSVISDANGVEAATNVNASNTPGRSYGSTRYYGWRDNAATPVYAQLLVGYWVWVGRVNGQIVSVTVEPNFSTQLVGFRASPRVYSAPGQSGGGQLLK